MCVDVLMCVDVVEEGSKKERNNNPSQRPTTPHNGKFQEIPTVKQTRLPIA
jgi:hypothetical protein